MVDLGLFPLYREQRCKDKKKNGNKNNHTCLRCGWYNRTTVYD